MKFFEIQKISTENQARLGIISTSHGKVRTPAFLPIGTRGSVKAVSSEELKFWGAEMILANTYHLWLRPGDALIHKAGGLHKFMSWDGPIFTDSGGFQVFSLGEKRHNAKNANTPTLSPPIRRRRTGGDEEGVPLVCKITDAGIEFQNEFDGATHLLTPELSIQIQSNLGSDIALVLDDVPGWPATKERIKKSLDLTLNWASRAKIHHQKIRDSSLNPDQRLFGIVQGGDYEEWRKQSVAGLQEIGFDGYGIGGLAVGEDAATMYRVLEFIIPYLEEEKPRHLLGVGYPEQLIKAVSLGCDTFDCVLPTRNARHGQLFINSKSGERPLPVFDHPPPARTPQAGRQAWGGVGGEVEPWYDIINIFNEKFKEDFTPVDNTCNCYGCLHHSRAYLRHLFMMKEPLGIRLATMHNLRFYLNLMEKIRRAIEFDSFEELLEKFQE